MGFYCINDKFTLSLSQQNRNKLSLTNNGKTITIQRDGYNTHIDKIWSDYAFIYCDNNIIQYNDTSIKKYQWSIKFQDDSNHLISFGIISTGTLLFKSDKSKTLDVVKETSTTFPIK